MAKVSLGGPLIGALFNSVTPPVADRKRARKPRTNKTTLGEDSVPGNVQQHGELASDKLPPKMPTDLQRIKDEARHAKRSATEDWIAGRKSTQDHEHIHRRANHILSGHKPREFRGKTGERALKGW